MATDKVFEFPRPGAVGLLNYESSNFETNYDLYAQSYGFAGQEMRKGRKLTEAELGMPNPSTRISWDEVEEVGEPMIGPDGQLVEGPPVVVRRTGRLQQVDPIRYQGLVNSAIKNIEKYQEQRQKLVAHTLIHLDATLQLPMSQHEKYKEAFDNSDPVLMRSIMRECATGKGAHSAMVMLWRFLMLKQTGNTTIDFNTYVKKYNDIHADIMRQGTAEDILKLMFNAKFIHGLDQTMFEKRINEIMGEKTWPSFTDLQSELGRFVIAKGGFSLRDSSDGLLKVDATKTRQWTCWNCDAVGEHRSSDCDKALHLCRQCQKLGHLEKYCSVANAAAARKPPMATQARPPQGRPNDNRRAPPMMGRDRKPPMQSGLRKPNPGAGPRSVKPFQRPNNVKARSTEVGYDANDGGYEQPNDANYDNGDYDGGDQNENYDESDFYDQDGNWIGANCTTIVQFDEDGAMEENDACVGCGSNHLGELDLTQCMTCNRVSTTDDMDNERFVFDTACVGNGHVVRSTGLLSGDLLNERFLVSGYDGNHQTSSTVGLVDGLEGKAVHVPGAPNNLLNVLLLCDKINGSYRGDSKSMTIYDSEGAEYLHATRGEDGFLTCSYKDMKKHGDPSNFLRANPVNMTETPGEDVHFTAEERARAKEAWELCPLLGHPGFKSIIHGLDNGNYANHTHLCGQDVKNGIKIFGRCLSCLEGKIIAPKAIASKTPPATHVGERLYCDLKEYKGTTISGYTGYVFAVDEKSGYCSVVGIKNKTGTLEALKTIISVYNAGRHHVKHIVTDGETIFGSCQKPLAALGIQVTRTPAGLHNRRCERYVQTLEARKRCLQTQHDFIIPDKLEHHWTLAAADSINNSPLHASGNKTPNQLMHHRKPRIPEFKWGQPGVFYSPRDDTPGQHGEWGLFMGYVDGQHNNIRGWFPDRNGVFSRRKMVPADIYPADWGLERRIKPARIKRKDAQVSLNPVPGTTKAASDAVLKQFVDIVQRNVDIQSGAPVVDHVEHDPLNPVVNYIPPAPPLPPVVTHQSIASPPMRDAVGSSVYATPRIADTPAAVSIPPPVTPLRRHSEGAPGAMPQHQEGGNGVRRDLPVVSAAESVPLKTPVKTPVKPRAQPPPVTNSPVKALQLPASPPVEKAKPKKVAQAPPAPPPPAPAPVSNRPVRQAAQRGGWKAGPAKDAGFDFQTAASVIAEALELNDRAEKRLAANAMSIMDSVITCYRMSLKEAFKDESKLAMTREACNNELINLFETEKALQPLHKRSISREDFKAIIDGHMFFDDKFNADGSFKKRKARLVMNGNQEHPSLIGETHAPTVIPSSLFLTLGIAANNTESVFDALDIEGAFLSTEMPDHKVVIVRIRKELVGHFTGLYPFMSDYVGDDGCLYFRLRKFVYGLAEAARAFNRKLDAALKQIGFKPTKADPCVYVKKLPNGKRHILTNHVDDLFSLAPDEKARQQFKEDLKRLFRIKESEGQCVSYLGMVIKRLANGNVKVTQEGYVEDLIKRFGVKGKPVSSPAGPELLMDDNSPSFSDRRGYASLLMSLMYLARFTRPDILFATTYLATKTSNPSEADYAKARRILKYIASTKGRGLVFRKSELVVRFYADASHHLHWDALGHTGIVATIGGTIILARSVKQKLQARSSAEAELIAVEECCTYVVHMRYLCHELGIPVDGPTMIGQDNQSAMIIAANGGGSFKRTKHMVGKFGYLKERLDHGDAYLHYVSTKAMLADMFTKPVTKDILDRHCFLLGIRA